MEIILPISFKDKIENNPGKSIFTMDKIWKDRKGLAKKYVLFLSPDSNAYCSRINPVFSFEVESFLQSFCVISLRDGVYPLMRFFFMNPRPHRADAHIIIDEKLSPLVPLEWVRNVYVRKMFIKEKLFEAKKVECLLLASPDIDNLPLDVLKQELEKKSVFIKETNRISIFFSSCNKIGEEHAEIDSSWRYQVFQVFLKMFPEQEIYVLDWNNLQKMNMSGVNVFEINPLKFYCSDSSLMHVLLQKGAGNPEFKLDGLSDWHQENISINHGYYIYPLKKEHPPLYDETMIKEIFNNSINIKVKPKNYTDLKLSNKSFKDFCTMVAREIYLEGRIIE